MGITAPTGECLRLNAIADARHAVERAQSQLAEVVRGAHESGISWSTIGNVLGVSKQATWSRYAKEEAIPLKARRQRLQAVRGGFQIPGQVQPTAEQLRRLDRVYSTVRQARSRAR
jgi:hypothetical protein